MVRVRGRGSGRANISGVVCYRTGHRSRFFYQTPGTPVAWCRDNLNVHLIKELANFAEEHQERLRIFQMPSNAPQLNPAESIRSPLKRHLADFAVADHTHPPHARSSAS
ncbi:transposase [Actinomadura nitritigenes]|uniref:transposase n=1 Tax=Actinomadura nitritigenes TaxID=134602 RepID=UPI0036C8F16C